MKNLTTIEVCEIVGVNEKSRRQEGHFVIGSLGNTEYLLIPMKSLTTIEVCKIVGVDSGSTLASINLHV